MSYLVRELKPTFERIVEPLVNLFQRLGITPNLLTFAGLFLVALGSVFLYLEERLLALLLLSVGSLCDLLDGSLARKLGKNSKFGAFIDSLTDRISDALPFIAIALSSEDKLVSLFAMLSILFSYTVSYARARAEGLGYELKVGLFERPERWIVLLTGIALNLIPLTLFIIAVGSLFTTLQRAYIFKKLERR
ncbi:MAG: CDP-alcohol phosphatidyltransferase family protein [Aquificaceae bacterium]